MSAKVPADFILKCVLPGATNERDSSVLYLCLTHGFLGEESGEKEGLFYSAIHFDNAEPLNNQIVFFLHLAPNWAGCNPFLTGALQGVWQVETLLDICIQRINKNSSFAWKPHEVYNLDVL